MLGLRIVFLCFVSYFPALSQQYQFQELKVNGQPANPRAINNPGTIVGSVFGGGFVLRDGGKLTYPINFDRYRGPLYAVNNLGDMIGIVSFCERLCGTSSIIFSGGHVVKWLDFLYPETEVRALNSRGDLVAGNVILLADNTFIGIEFPGPNGSAYYAQLHGIAWDRAVVGCYLVPNGSDEYIRRAFLRGPKGNMMEIKIPNALESCAVAINDAAGKIIGTYRLAAGGPLHSFLYDYLADLTILEAGPTPLAAKTISFQPVDYPGAENTMVSGINGKGTIVGTANMQGGETFGFVAILDAH